MLGNSSLLQMACDMEPPLNKLLHATALRNAARECGVITLSGSSNDGSRKPQSVTYQIHG